VSAEFQLVFDFGRNSLYEHGLPEVPAVTERFHCPNEGIEGGIVFTPLVREAEDAIGCIWVANGLFATAFDTDDANGVKTTVVDRLFGAPPKWAIRHRGYASTARAFDVIFVFHVVSFQWMFFRRKSYPKQNNTLFLVYCQVSAPGGIRSLQLQYRLSIFCSASPPKYRTNLFESRVKCPPDILLPGALIKIAQANA
jgi:hypothetical protein